MATLNEIPLSFLKEHSYILYVSGRSDYRFNYGKETLFPKDFNGSVGDFLDSDLKNEYSDLYGRILKEKLDQAKRELIIKNIIIDLYEAVNCKVPFGVFRKNSVFPEKKRPAIYKSEIYDGKTLEEVFRLCDRETRAKMGLNLAANNQFLNCIRLKEFEKIGTDDSFLSQIKSFVDCYIKYASYENNSFAESFEFKFKTNPFRTESDITGLSVAAYTVNESVNKSITKCRSLLFDGILECFLPISFKERIANLHSYINSHSIVKGEDLIAFIGSAVDEQTMSFVCELFGIKMLEFADSEFYYVKKKVSIRQIRSLYQNLDEYFSTHPIGITLGRIKKDLLQNVSPLEKDVVVEYIGVSNRFYSRDSEGDKVYFIKWQYLKRISDRIARILFESGNNEMEINDIIKVYNEKCKRSDIRIRSIIGTINNDREDLIECIGRTGIWRLRKATSRNQRQYSGAEELIKQFIATLDDDNELMFDNLKAYLKNRGVDSYPDRSLGTTLNKLGYCKKAHGSNIYILAGGKQWSTRELVESIVKTLMKAPGKSMLKSELLTEIKSNSARTVNNGTFDRAIHLANSILTIEKLSSRKTLISLIPGKIDEIEFSIYETVRQSPEYHKAICQTAIDELLRCENVTMPMSDLKKCVEKYVPSDIKSNIIYKIFESEDIFIKSKTTPKNITLNLQLYKELNADKTLIYDSGNVVSKNKDVESFCFGFNWGMLKKTIVMNQKKAFSKMENRETVLDKMYDIMKGQALELEPDNQFWKALDLLNRMYFYPTSCYDRELLSTKLILGIENYISNLLLLNGIVNDEMGLSNKITLAQKVGALPKRDEEHKINKIIGLIISNRNRYSHTNNEKQHSFDDIFRNIDVCLNFYVYVAEYNMKSN